MPTYARIAVKRDDGYKSILLLWDGGPSYAGKRLVAYWPTSDHANRLVDGGDLEALSVNALENTRRMTPAATHNTLDELLKHAAATDVRYLYQHDGTRWVLYFPMAGAGQPPVYLKAHLLSLELPGII